MSEELADRTITDVTTIGALDPIVPELKRKKAQLGFINISSVVIELIRIHDFLSRKHDIVTPEDFSEHVDSDIPDYDTSFADEEGPFDDRFTTIGFDRTDKDSIERKTRELYDDKDLKTMTLALFDLIKIHDMLPDGVETLYDVRDWFDSDF